MQPEIEKLLAEIEAYASEEKVPLSFVLFEEYSGCEITQMISSRRDIYARADRERRGKLEIDVVEELQGFRSWLQDVKNIDPRTAYFCSVSLKSLLLGLPIGVKIAQLFNLILEKKAEKSC